MAVVLRFADAKGFVRERFLDLVHVQDTKSLSLKSHICELLSLHKLDIKNMRGQGYDGASNMRGQWNGLQVLILKECPFAYYVHCFARRLQLTLVAAASDVISVHQFFDYVTSIVNVVTNSSKRHDQLLSAQANQILEQISLKRLETVLKDIINDRSCTFGQRSEADEVYDKITSFEFVFILHVMVEILEITNDLYKALQRKSQDIENDMHLVSSTRIQLQQLREEVWLTLFDKAKVFCCNNKIEIPDMQMIYKAGKGRDRINDIYMEHHLKVDLFNVCIDFQLQELQSRFCKNVTELLILTSSLNSRDEFVLFNVDDICKLESKFYPVDFTDQELSNLKYELNHFKINLRTSDDLQNVSTISELCRVLKEKEV